MSKSKVVHLQNTAFREKKNWREAYRFLLELLKMNNLTGNHFHEASIYNYTTIVLASFYYWAKWFLYTHCIYQLSYFWLRPYILLTRTQHTSRRQNFQEAFKSGLAAARTENKHFVIPNEVTYCMPSTKAAICAAMMRRGNSPHRLQTIRIFSEWFLPPSTKWTICI